MRRARSKAASAYLPTMGNTSEEIERQGRAKSSAKAGPIFRFRPPELLRSVPLLLRCGRLFRDCQSYELAACVGLIINARGRAGAYMALHRRVLINDKPHGVFIVALIYVDGKCFAPGFDLSHFACNRLHFGCLL